jgi:hypothetical protein
VEAFVRPLEKFDARAQGADVFLEGNKGGVGGDSAAAAQRRVVQTPAHGGVQGGWELAFADTPTVEEVVPYMQGDAEYESANGAGIAHVVLMRKMDPRFKTGNQEEYQFVVCKTRMARFAAVRGSFTRHQLDGEREFTQMCYDAELDHGRFKPDNKATDALISAMQLRYGARKAGSSSLSSRAFNASDSMDPISVTHGWVAKGNDNDSQHAGVMSHEHARGGGRGAAAAGGRFAGARHNNPRAVALGRGGVEAIGRGGVQALARGGAAAGASSGLVGEEYGELVRSHVAAKESWETIWAEHNDEIQSNTQFAEQGPLSQVPAAKRWNVFFDDWIRTKTGEMLTGEMLNKLRRLTTALAGEPVARVFRGSAAAAAAAGGEEGRGGARAAGGRGAGGV